MRYNINERGERYADLERELCFSCAPAELWLLRGGEGALLMSTSPSAQNILSLRLDQKDGARVAGASVRALRGAPMGLRAQVFSASSSSAGPPGQPGRPVPPPLLAERFSVFREGGCDFSFPAPEGEALFLRLAYW